MRLHFGERKIFGRKNVQLNELGYGIEVQRHNLKKALVEMVYLNYSA